MCLYSCVRVCIVCIHKSRALSMCVFVFMCSCVHVCIVSTQGQDIVHVCVCVHVFVCACVYCVYTRAEAVHVCAGHPQELSLRFILSAF